MPNARRALSPTLAALALPPVVGAAQVLLPAGDFNAPQGAMLGQGPWRLTPAGGQRIAAALRQRGTDIPVDYEHQLLRAGTNGQPAPAAGWIEPAAIRWDAARGLVAEAVRWTERAAAMIGAGEYRYLSPVFPYAEGGEVLGLHSVALTNSPALDVLPEVALAAASLALLSSPEAPMDDLRERVVTLLNLPVTTTDEELVASLTAVLAEREARIAALAAQVQAAPPAELIADLQGQIAALTAAEADRRKAQVLTAALSDGRLIEGTPLYAHAAGLELSALEALTASLTPIAALAGTQTGGQPPAGAPEAGGFTAALAAEFGDEATWRAYQRAQAAGRIKHANLTTED